MSDLDGGPFEIVEAEVQGRPMRVFRNAPPSLRAIWDLSAAHGDKPFLVLGDDRYTFAEAHEVVAALAGHLASNGVTQGDRVAVAMRNLPEWALSFWAAAALGAVVVPLNAWWTGPELAYGLADSGARALLADPERLERIEPLLGETKVETVVAAPFARDAFGPPRPLPDVDVHPDDVATIMYTSGTTGRPKGAIGSGRNIGGHVMNALYAVASRAVTPAPGAPPAPSPVTLLTFPLFHVGGLHSFLIPYTVVGGTLVLTRKWNAAEALDLIEREGVNNVAGVPTTMFELLDEANRQGRTLDSLAGVGSGATLVPPELVRRIDTQLASRAAPTNGYGLTETSGAAIVNAGADYVAKPDSVGRPISPVTEVRIADPDGNAVPTGETGEIWLRGPTIFQGYFGLPEATEAALVDGWFRTGDVGRLDDEGCLYVVDRLKDVIIRGGENVYAAEIEAVLYEHPDVAEVAIVGLPDERLGEQVAAFIRPRPDAVLDADAVRAFVAGRLAAFKVPSVVHLVHESLPRNAAGKVLKRELRETVA